ncbi:hypothetical protein [Pseudopedobacter sp.]|uniref:hypothetical protein n=1 Tax=Pseudopedobacter sp. TaxID=1936787 RepID=UPI0033406D59
MKYKLADFLIPFLSAFSGLVFIMPIPLQNNKEILCDRIWCSFITLSNSKLIPKVKELVNKN